MNNGLANWCDFCQCSHSSSSCFHPGRKMLYALEGERDKLQRKLDDIEDILYKMDNWCKAYPLDIFPEPDLIKARDVLEFARISLDSISASAMRHVVNGMSDYVQEALKKLEE